ncbi:MAG: hypothetical protein ACYTFP_03935 [Planctomycetota bacterium]
MAVSSNRIPEPAIASQLIVTWVAEAGAMAECSYRVHAEVAVKFSGRSASLVLPLSWNSIFSAPA